MVYFIHVANVVYLASYSVKNILLLRCLTILGILLCIPYYLAFVRYEAAVWSLVFLGINIYRLRTVKRGVSVQAG